MIERENTEAVIADKAYDSDEFLALIAQMGAEAVVPPKANRIEQHEHDENLYADGDRTIETRSSGFTIKPSNTYVWQPFTRKPPAITWPSGM